MRLNNLTHKYVYLSQITKSKSLIREQLPLYGGIKWYFLCPFSLTFQMFQKHYNDVEKKTFK